ncbi:type II toxin-antitoxin system VapC family toxin [Spirosoma soli]|uniref:Type II toxin-antitoxin system VapC family toxin n=1 Tax=Spirosoma soli TaxID=1770529 RepID=A0ABW5MB89_9BACT
MQYLLDTHTLLWLLNDESVLPKATLSLLKDPASRLQVSVASIWEIAIKRGLGKLDINQPTQVLVNELPKLSIELLPITPDHVLRVETLPFHHRDPFDRIIIAQALVESYIIVSKDTNFPLYPVEILWS